MRQYLDLLQDIMDHGVDKNDRTGTGTRSVFGRQLRFNLQDGFPLVTTKKVFFKGVAIELLWILSGNTNIKFLEDNGVHIWREWADGNGDLGPVYGKQFRAWTTYVDTEWCTEETEDQLANAIKLIKTDPNSRRIIVSAWNVADLDQMALVPCHYTYQFNVTNGRLNCMMTQRSCDTFLGLPFNSASYALLTHMVAQVTNLQPGELVISLGDTHIYSNHFEQVELQLTREPYPLPYLTLNPDIKSIDDFRYEDVELHNYQFHPTIKAEIAV